MNIKKLEQKRDAKLLDSEDVIGVLDKTTKIININALIKYFLNLLIIFL